MTNMIGMANGLGPVLHVLLNAVWQVAAIFLIAYAAVKLFRPRSPLTRHLVWLLALVGMVLCPLITLSGLAGSYRLVEMPVGIGTSLDTTHDASAGFVAAYDDLQPNALPDTSLGERDEPPSDRLGVSLTDPRTGELGEAPGPDGGLSAKDTAGVDTHRGALRPGVVAASVPDRVAQPNWLALVAAVWVGGVVVLSMRFLIAQLVVWRLRRRSLPVRDASLCRAFTSAKAMAGVSRPVAFRVSSRLAVPVAAGLFQPCVLFPEELVERLSSSELQAIAVHELTHIRRMDPAVIVLERLVQAVLFFHPAVWLASRALSVAREEACDEAVVRATGRPVSYAKCLTSLYEHIRVLSHCRVASLGVAHYRSKLFTRIETLLSDRMLLLRRLPRPLSGAMIGVACVTLILIGGTTFVQGQATQTAPTQTQAAVESERDPRTATPEVDAHENADDTVVAEVRYSAGQYRWINDGGPDGANVHALALCEGSPDVLYAGTSNGLFKSTDGAKTWTAAAPQRAWAQRYGVHALAVHPTNPDVVYAPSFDGLFKSADGGESWEDLGIHRDEWGSGGLIELNPKDPNTIYVARESGCLIKSTDGGKTWQLKNSGLCYESLECFGLIPSHPDTLYIAGAMTAFYQSDDNGVTWRRYRPNDRAGDDADYPSLGEFARDPDDPNRVSVTLEHAGKQTRYVSTDGGGEWRTQDPATLEWELTWPRRGEGESKRMELHIEKKLLYLTSNGGDSWHAVDVPFDPLQIKTMSGTDEDGGVLYADVDAGDDEFYYSNDGGKSWEFFYSAESDPGMTQTATIELVRKLFFYRIGNVMAGSKWMFRRLVGHPSKPDVVYRPSSTGVEKTQDYGKTWTVMNRGLTAFAARAVVCDPDEPGLVYTSGKAGVFKSTDGAHTWTQVGEMPVGRSGMFLHPLDSAVLLLPGTGRESQTYISTDRGDTWRPIPELRQRQVYWIVFDPENADVLHALCADGVFKTTDRGATWRSTDGTVPKRFAAGDQCVHQTNATIIYQVSEARELLRSTDVGTTWKPIKSLESEATRITVHVHPTDPKVIALGYERRLHVSRNAGETWQVIEIPRNWSVHHICMDPVDPDIFIVTAQSILLTFDGGRTFDMLSNDFDFARNVVEITISPSDDAVYVTTDGAGIYRLESK